ncbi:MAG TPA: quinolinate synthase NadA [bacterium]|nr:quinolinate synthase NadA [bacterium]
MADIISEIQAWKEKRRAVILAHNYQPPEIQALADFLGDSLDLSRLAAGTEHETVVFCGVKFMAETAKILAPEKTVLLPDLQAGCPMADMVRPEDIRERRAAYPGAPVVTYINSSAEVKAESDYICTSANAVRLVSALAEETVLFFPDQNLGDFVQERTAKKMILWPGYCPTHQVFIPEELAALKAANPGAVLIAHPECRREVRRMADEVLSTGGMVKWARESRAKQAIVATEIGMLTRLRRENPAIEYLPGSSRAVCPNMKKISLEKVLWSLKELAPAIEVPEATARRSRLALERMLKF